MVLAPGEEAWEFPVLLFIEGLVSGEFVACFLPDSDLLLHERVLLLGFVPGVNFCRGISIFFNVAL
jgi:hypothetical protein